MITRAALLTFARSRRYAVESSVHASGAAQSAIVGVAVSDDFEIVFDTIRTSRKGRNLQKRAHVAFVFGDLEGRDQRTLQYEGTADEPDGADRDRLVALYLSVFPDGRERQPWPGLTYFRAQPRWVRFSDYNQDPPEIVEWDQASLRALR